MAEIDIENPGASEAALKAAIQALVPISTTTISSPVNYADITLPSGYAGFRLLCVGFASADTANLGMVFSQDGGVTWLHDFDDAWDDYKLVSDQVDSVSPGIDNPDTYENYCAELTAQFTVNHGIADVMITPGSASQKAFVMAISAATKADYAPVALRSVANVCKTNTARVNALRIFCGGEDPDSPTVIFSAGTFALYGVL